MTHRLCQACHQAKQMADRPGVEIVYQTSGNDDLMAVAEANNTDELNALIEEIRNLPSVSTRTRLILEEVFHSPDAK